MLLARVILIDRLPCRTEGDFDDNNK